LAKWGNDLRQTYRTIAQAGSIAELDIHLLMNHSGGGVNAGYINYATNCSTTICVAAGNNFRHILKHCQIRTKGKTVASRMWFAPTVPSRAVNVLEAVAATPQGLDTSFSARGRDISEVQQVYEIYMKRERLSPENSSRLARVVRSSDLA